MSESTQDSCPTQCNPRREFLAQTAMTAGGLVLGLALGVEANEQNGRHELVALSDYPALGTVGGSAVIELTGGKIIVARTAADTFVAVSAICTHRGCTIGYDADNHQFACPCHGARYGLDGTVLRGPARHNIAAYQTREAVMVDMPAADQ